MKSGKKLEKVLTVNDTLNGTIEKLILQNGICREKVSNQENLEFYCSKKGEVYVGEPFSSRGRGTDRIYSVSGEVREENGETVVKIYSQRRKIEIFDRYFTICLYFVTAFAYFLIKILWNIPIEKTDFIAVGLLLFLSVWITVLSKKEKHNKTNDIEIMINKVVKRVEAIARWDD